MMPTGFGFMRRISWGAILVGVFVALAVQLVLVALGTFVGYGAASITNLTELNDVNIGIGIWTAASVLIATFIGAWVAARIGGSMTRGDGIWHGISVWSLLIVGGVVLATIGVTGILGFGLVATNLVETFTVDATPVELETATDVATATSGLFLLAALLSLAAAVFGGWLGSRLAVRRAGSMAVEEERAERRAA
ncbi:MAG: hypothetical protein IBX61_03730 [Thermoleophilia bacterium]|nr:hypothetical protein [Thermoleophilia bacterium]